MEPEKDMFDQWREEKDLRPWYVKLWNSVSLWWKFDGRYILSNIKLGFRNIWYWLPIIWKDRHWDHAYIYDILKHKLKAQAHRLHTADMHLSAKRDAEIIRTCVRLIDKVNNDFYSMEYMDYEKNKMWFEPSDKEGFSELKSKVLEDNLDEYFKKYPLIYKQCLSGEGMMGRHRVKNSTFDPNDRHFIAMDIGHTNQDRAHKLLFKIISENIYKWWD